jgi:2-methylcitrate dehydratase
VAVALHWQQHFIPRAKIKFWPVVYNMQALVWAALELRKKVKIEDIEAIDVETYWSAWHESGSEPAKWDPTTRETADHSLPYILAWTLRHGLIDHNAFVPESYLDPSIRPLMNRVTVRVIDEFEKDFPRVFEHFHRSTEARTCDACGHLNPAPDRYRD